MKKPIKKRKTEIAARLKKQGRMTAKRLAAFKKAKPRLHWL